MNGVRLMSDSVVNNMTESEPAAGDAAAVQAGRSAGRLLREAREAAGMSLPALAASLKVPLAKLEALERDDHAAFQDHTFMRALAMTVCRSLRVDAAEIMALLPRLQPKSLAGGAGINATFKERSFKGAGTPLKGGGQGSRKIALGVLVILVAAAAVYFVPRSQDEAAAGAVAGSTVAGSAGAEAPQAAAPVPGAVTEMMAPAAGAEEVSAAANAVPAALAAAPAPAAIVAAGPEAPATATAEAGPGAAAAAPVLQLRANAQTWVRVKDSSGRVVLEKTLAQGDSVVAEGALPLSVVVGNAKGVQVSVRGEPLDIVKGTRDNVARFEVK